LAEAPLPGVVALPASIAVGRNRKGSFGVSDGKRQTLCFGVVEGRKRRAPLGQFSLCREGRRTRDAETSDCGFVQDVWTSGGNADISTLSRRSCPLTLVSRFGVNQSCALTIYINCKATS